jgi:hypothetical protein
MLNLFYSFTYPKQSVPVFYAGIAVLSIYVWNPHQR